MECPTCKADVDDDSWFCDQCGTELFKCSQCGRPGKGKRCAFDGKPLTSCKSAVSTAVTPNNRLRLVNSHHGVSLYPANGDVLGRRNGPHVGELARFDQISGSHLKIQQWPDGHWSAADLNSTNHSYYDGRQLEAFKDQTLAPGSMLTLGDIALQISFE